MPGLAYVLEPEHLPAGLNDVQVLHSVHSAHLEYQSIDKRQEWVLYAPDAPGRTYLRIFRQDSSNPMHRVQASNQECVLKQLTKTKASLLFESCQLE